MTKKQIKRLTDLMGKEVSTLTPEEVVELETLSELAAKAAEEDDEDPESEAPVTRRRKPEEPKKVTVSGTIVDVSDVKPKGGKFNHDTIIVTISIFGTEETLDVFITTSQWAAYGCDKLLYKGNVIVFTLDDNIKDVTGFKENAEDTTLTKFHGSNFKSFVRAIEKNTNNFIMELAMKGIPIEVIKLLMDNVTQIRTLHKSTSGSAIESRGMFT